jgi:hypothetical protein
MARQIGLVKFEGKLGGLSGYQTSDGVLIRQAPASNKARFDSAGSMQRTRENASEFGGSAKAAKTLRTALRQVVQNSSDKRMVSRLTKKFIEVIKTDEINDRGQRNILDAETELLQGFEFNDGAKFDTTVFTPINPVINRATGLCEIRIDATTPTRDIVAPTGATHYKIVAAAASVNFEAETSVSKTAESALMPYNSTPTGDDTLDLEMALGANSTNPIFVVVGIEFYQQVNGKNYPLQNGAFNALKIVAVSGI